ncbi:4Fe-4S binding protein [Oceanidesulfovibrio marinus]|uniref:4Fe-4S dicluster domain-containing protein n=1 Tax=Oceanidesulfovibrio marinus TaxID=370038 RepID=A0A6P1ZMU3_9BACT|nr:4Fe-4S binding protein [Oceanidesulfovibrio marinus]QJT10151.1 4Fe-4S dicluster domain-containing protein [Oceanidesulfovibrio marinus]TVM35735.1 hypothetical protein DQK91_03465 [Oceanidesulfovibrio marinus]
MKRTYQVRHYKKKGPQSVAAVVGDFFSGLWSLVVGLGVTGRNFADSQVTVHYPRQDVGDEQLVGYRGHIELVPKPKDPFAPKCILCMMCARVCPSGCITVKMKKQPKEEPVEEGAKPKKAPKEVGVFHLNYNLCSLCSLCVQSCPVGSLRHSRDVYLSGFQKEDFEYDLMERLHKQAEAAPKKAPAPEKEAETAEAAG